MPAGTAADPFGPPASLRASMVIVGNRLFVAGNEFDIWDISTPTQPQEVLHDPSGPTQVVAIGSDVVTLQNADLIRRAAADLGDVRWTVRRSDYESFEELRTAGGFLLIRGGTGFTLLDAADGRELGRSGADCTDFVAVGDIAWMACGAGGAAAFDLPRSSR
jgi:hypothetical protein